MGNHGKSWETYGKSGKSWEIIVNLGKNGLCLSHGRSHYAKLDDFFGGTSILGNPKQKYHGKSWHRPQRYSPPSLHHPHDVGPALLVAGTKLLGAWVVYPPLCKI